MRVVLDSNVIVSACLSPQGTSATIVELALLGAFTLYLSPEVLAEYQEVLMRPKFSRQSERINFLLEGIEDIAEMVNPERRLTISPDDEDNRFLECAQAAQANLLITGNQRHFPKQMENTRIVTPREFLTEIGF